MAERGRKGVVRHRSQPDLPMPVRGGGSAAEGVGGEWQNRPDQTGGGRSSSTTLRANR